MSNDPSKCKFRRFQLSPKLNKIGAHSLIAQFLNRNGPSLNSELKRGNKVFNWNHFNRKNFLVPNRFQPIFSINSDYPVFRDDIGGEIDFDDDSVNDSGDEDVANEGDEGIPHAGREIDRETETSWSFSIRRDNIVVFRGHGNKLESATRSLFEKIIWTPDKEQ